MRVSANVILCFLLSVLALGSAQSCADGPSVPHSGSMRYARNLFIDRRDGYSLVTLLDPWDTSTVRRIYCLLQENARVPQDIPQCTVIRVPVKRAAIYSSVHASIAAQLGAADRIAAVCEPEYITSAEVLKRMADGLTVSIGPAVSPDIERIMDVDADVIIAPPFENAGFGASEKLGIPIVEAAEYMENDPLGCTEWIRFYGILFGREAQADSLFGATCFAYDSLKALIPRSGERPSLLLELKYGSGWTVPSGGSYIGKLNLDAGFDYAFSHLEGTNSVPLTFEQVYDIACDADVWTFKYASDHPVTYDELESQYSPYSRFKAFRSRNIFACNTLLTTYYDDIDIHPDYILADLISISHPDILPGYERRYFQPLQ